MEETAKNKPSMESFVILWIIACALSFATGDLLGAVLIEKVGIPVGNLIAAGFPEVIRLTVSSVVASMLRATLSSALVGVAQWLALRKYLRRAGWWLPVYILGGVVVAVSYSLFWAFMNSIFDYTVVNPLYVYALILIVFSPFGGLIKGTLEWTVLRGELPYAAHWIWIRMASYFFDALIYIPVWFVASSVRNPLLQYGISFVSGLASGVVIGLLTGFAMYYLLTKREVSV